MGGTKIFVFQLKKLIRAAIFAVVAIAAIVTLVVLLLPKHGGAPTPTSYAPGTYSAQIILHNKPVSVDVTFGKSEIIAVELRDMNHAQELAYPLFKPTMEVLSKEIVRRQSTAFSLTPENAITGQILLDAVDAAIAQAAK